MDPDLQQIVDRAIRALALHLRGDEHLESEMQRARRVFLGEARCVDGRGIAESAERRFLEWFVLERTSEVLGSVPVAVPRFASDEALLGSHAGAYLVESVDGSGATSRDLQDETLLEIVAPARALEAGDLVVGRLFPAGVGQWLPSVAATVFRPGRSLGEAFMHDVRRLDLDRRLEQIELEHLLMRRPEVGIGQGAAEEGFGEPLPPLEHLEADLARVLGDAGSSTTEISEALAASERPGQVTGPLLDELAFETEADLDAARELLLQIWNVHHARARGREQSGPEVVEEDSPSAGRSDETLGERMVRRLDEGLAQHRDVDGLFAELEAMAGLEPGAADDAENPYDAADENARQTGLDDASGGGDVDAGTAGNLGPLVEEFLWEGGDPESEEGRVLRTWVELQGNAALPRCELEDVTGRDVTRLLLHVYLAAKPAERRRAVEHAFAAVQEFLAWAEQTQEFSLEDALIEAQDEFLAEVGRISDASQALSGEEAPGGRPALLEVVEVTDTGFGLCGEEGDDFWVPVTAAPDLRIGDLVLGAAPGRERERQLQGLVIVLPQFARKLME